MRSYAFLTMFSCVAAINVSFECEYGEMPGTGCLGNHVSLKGNSRAHSRRSYNMLGGGFSFELDASRVNGHVTAAVYLISPNKSSGYCDANSHEPCLELDAIELNGHVMQTTWHTKSTDDSCGPSCNCNNLTGCFSLIDVNTTWSSRNSCRNPNIDAGGTIDPSKPFKVTANISNEGDFRVVYSQGSKHIDALSSYSNQQPSPADKVLTVKQLKAHGAVVMVSLWQGKFTPGFCHDAWGRLEESQFDVRRLTVTGIPVLDYHSQWKRFSRDL